MTTGESLVVLGYLFCAVAGSIMVLGIFLKSKAAVILAMAMFVLGLYLAVLTGTVQ